MKNFLRSMSLVLVLALVLSMAPAVFAEPTPDPAAVNTEVTTIEKYGNLDLKIKGSELMEAGYACGDLVTVSMNGYDFEMPVVNNYSDVDQGSMLCRIVVDEEKGKDYVVLAINMGNLAEKAEIATKKKIEEEPGYEWTYCEGVEPPVKVTIAIKEKQGYHEGWLAHQLERTNEREDYPRLNDSDFANFREVETSGMGSATLFRSSSPINTELNRNGYADAAMRGAGVKTVMNLADSKEEMEGHEGFAGSYYSKQNIIPLNLGVDFQGADFKAGLAKGFRFIATHEGPYLIHCTEGKDRAGFTISVLEALMGALGDEIVTDYMRTYYNYYRVEAGTEKYAAIANSNIKKTLATAFGIPDIMDRNVNLAAEAADYMISDLGMTEEEVAALKAKLSASHALEITALEKYGHADVAIAANEFLERFDYGDVVEVRVNNSGFWMPVCSDYTDVPTGAKLIRVKPGKDFVALAINYGKFAEAAGIGHKNEETGEYEINPEFGDSVEIQLVLLDKGGYREEWEIHHLERTNERKDYADLNDEQFANFRNVETEGMGRLALYRSSSPINPELNRNSYADAAMKKAGVKVAVNLANTQDEAKAYNGFADTYYSKQNNIYLGLDANFNGEDFKVGLKKGFEHMIANEGPYLIHCNEGKDRAGFVTAVLEALMGADAQSIVADYMETFYNYYGVKKGDTKYDIIAQDNIIANLNLAFGTNIASPYLNLQKVAEGYMKYEIGLTDEQISALKANLSKDYRPDSKFDDVSRDDWYYTYVIDMELSGILQGTSETTFSPMNKMTRGQLTVALYRIAGEPTVQEKSDFKDVPANAYYANAVAWAQDEKIINGVGDELFAPNRTISRQEVITIIYRMNGSKDVDTDLSRFKDTDLVSAFALPALQWAVKTGIINGATHDGKTGFWLDPLNATSRAQASKILCNMMAE